MPAVSTVVSAPTAISVPPASFMSSVITDNTRPHVTFAPSIGSSGMAEESLRDLVRDALSLTIDPGSILEGSWPYSEVDGFPGHVFDSSLDPWLKLSEQERQKIVEQVRQEMVDEQEGRRRELDKDKGKAYLALGGIGMIYGGIQISKKCIGKVLKERLKRANEGKEAQGDKSV